MNTTANQAIEKINTKIAKRDERGDTTYREGLVALAGFLAANPDRTPQPVSASFGEQIDGMDLRNAVVEAHREGIIAADETNAMISAISATLPRLNL